MRRYYFVTAMLCLATAVSAQNSPDELMQLIRNNDLATLKSRLAKGADVNAHDARGTTLLMQAAGFGTVDAVKLLLSNGANVNAKNQFEMTALLFGAANQEKARLLIEKGADVSAKNKAG